MNFCRAAGDVGGTNACAAAAMASGAQMKVLYQSHGPALLRYLERAFGDCGPAEDLLQETFVAALGAEENCLRAASPRAFLFGIARHVGMDARRRAGRRMTVSLGEHQVAAPEATPAGEVEEMRGGDRDVAGVVAGNAGTAPAGGVVVRGDRCRAGRAGGDGTVAAAYGGEGVAREDAR